MTPRISIILPLWGSPPDVRRQVEAAADSISSTTTTPYEVIVVCNTRDESLERFVEGRRDIARWCVCSQNAGVSRGWNIGAQLAEGDYLCFMNQDVTVGPACLDRLVAVLDSDPQIGIAGPEGSTWEVSERTAQHVAHCKPASNEFVDCDVVSGFLFLIRSEVYDLIGGFDRHFTPCWYEDIDASFRVRDYGYRSVAVGGLTYQHPWGVSAGDVWKSVTFLGHEERLRSVRERNLSRFINKRRMAKRGNLAGRSVPTESRAPERNSLRAYFAERFVMVRKDTRSLAKHLLRRGGG